MKKIPEFFMKNNEINEDIVHLAYKLILGRDAESENAVRSHLNLETIEKLRKHMMNSQEFKAKQLQSQFAAGSKWVAVDVLDCFIQWIDLHDRYVSHGCLNNNWEPSESKYFISKLRPGNVILDIGANIGWFSLLAAKHIGGKGTIHSFEPRPETANMLRRTVADNGLQNQIKIWELALSDEWGSIDLVWGKNTDNPGGSFIATKHVDAKEFDFARVTCSVLDDLFPELAPDLVKIDVEGAEPRVMRGAKNLLQRKHPAILSELFPQQLQAVSQTTCAQYIDQMRSYGYSCYLLEDGVPTQRLNDFPADTKKELESVVFEKNNQHM